MPTLEFFILITAISIIAGYLYYLTAELWRLRRVVIILLDTLSQVNDVLKKPSVKSYEKRSAYDASRRP